MSTASLALERMENMAGIMGRGNEEPQYPVRKAWKTTDTKIGCQHVQWNEIMREAVLTGHPFDRGFDNGDRKCQTYHKKGQL
jgi:hypothetical protein